ncbi:phage portal protein [Nesterenkonia jeotgali]|uniref:Phage portal protein n=1 Tax=Nesterenkonia jeotgali TaxID=317018 RepID=A0A0W8ICX6_9MICC|nr:phage portal protein [Nesterenkonia jeotgali]KUG57783.1 hypothetical protein AVL63_04470 [Nesterenkonia jeotgali]
MSFWSNLLSIPVRALSPKVTYLGSSFDMASAFDPSGLDAARMWRSQPHLRTVVDFRARNIAQLGLHVYKRSADGGRERDHSSPLAQALMEPDVNMDSHQLIYALSGDLDLHERAYWLITTNAENGARRLRRLPPSWVSPVWEDPWNISHYLVAMGDKQRQIPPEEILAFSSYSPESVYGCSPTIESLKEVLLEQIEASQTRRQMWKNKARISGIIERPTGAPDWSKEAKNRFLDDWYASFSGAGSKAGGTPLLGDGMTFKVPQLSMDNQGYGEAVKLSLQTVASSFHVQPVMVGDSTGANYSNVKEFHKMLYSDTLGPTLDRVQSAINTFLLPRLGMDRETYYVEFNVKDKLKGSFLEEARVMTSMTGGPILTINEGRARQNLPSIGPAGDELLTPMNVLRGGGTQASPGDSGSQNVTTGDNNDVENRNAAPALTRLKVKSAEPAQFSDRIEDLFRRTFDRQRQSVKSRLGAGAQWWDEERWDEELGGDLQEESIGIVMEASTQVLAEMGVEATAFNLALTANYLMTRSDGQAHDMNEATRAALEERFSGEDSDTDAVDEYFDGVGEQRAKNAGVATAAALAGFASVEAGRQAGGRGAQKSWVVTSGNPRDSHSGMNGETVGVDELFSNGMKWPGAIGDPNEVAGCQCALDIIPGERD